jgi:hypothetical protein
MASELPFHLAVTTTDGTGLILGEVVSDETADVTAGFVAAIEAAGIQGERDEQGFGAALLAADADQNDFARADADLEVVIYADEDDHGDLSAEDFLGALRDLHPGRSVVVSAVVGDLPNGCASATGAADAGSTYIDAQAATGGARESICTSQTEAMLGRLASAVLGLRTEFYLSELPLLASMEITVDGVAIPRRDADGWRYDGADNSVIFDGWSIPRPGAVIQAHYFDYTGSGTIDTGAGG